MSGERTGSAGTGWTVTVAGADDAGVVGAPKGSPGFAGTGWTVTVAHADDAAATKVWYVHIAS